MTKLVHKKQFYISHASHLKTFPYSVHEKQTRIQSPVKHLRWKFFGK